VQIPFVIWYVKGQFPIHPVAIMLPLVGLLNGWVERRGAAGLGISMVQPLRSLFLALVNAALAFGGWLFAAGLTGWPLSLPEASTELLWPLAESFLVGVFVLAAWEELFNRGYLQTRLQDAWGSVGILVTTILFAAAHVPSVLVEYDNDWVKALLRFVETGMSGIVLGYIYWRTRSTLATLAVHGLGNCAAGALPLLTGLSSQEILYGQPGIQILWRAGQAGLMCLLARALFETRSDRSEVREAG
jgi:membrane protease YdiL (CAAX protease family)